MPVTGDLAGDLLFGIIGTIYGSCCMVVAPLWIRNFRLREARRMLAHTRKINKSASVLPEYYRTEFAPMLNTFAELDMRLEGKELGRRGFWDHGLYRGWIDVTRGHYALKSETMVLKTKMNLYAMEEKWRLKKIMERIRWDAPAEETLSDSGRYMHHHHEYF